uniref:Uncharacterized protein n=1 Tax=Arundo donax TaxID=35708 RepID=A0A0A9HPQ9_ARUDO
MLRLEHRVFRLCLLYFGRRVG